LRIRRTLPATILATLAFVAAPGGAASSAQPVAKAACTHDTAAVIGGKHKCLGAGEYCSKRYEHRRRPSLAPRRDRRQVEHLHAGELGAERVCVEAGLHAPDRAQVCAGARVVRIEKLLQRS